MKKKVLLREMILYVCIGAMTTVVSFSTYFFCMNVLKLDYRVSTAVGWVFAVTFAFFTNRKFVFRSTGTIPVEIVLFFAARVVSLGVEEGWMILMIEGFSTDKLAAKISAQFVIMVVNFILSKVVVFKYGEPAARWLISKIKILFGKIRDLFKKKKKKNEEL